MKKALLVLSLISSSVFAETATFAVDGMHCSGCKNILTKKVCENETIKNSAESCDVKLLDEKAEKGSITIVSKKDMTIDREVLKAAVASAGEYKTTEVTAAEMAAAVASADASKSAHHHHDHSKKTKSKKKK